MKKKNQVAILEDRLKAAGYGSLNHYMQSNQWAAKKQAVFQRFDFRCALCASARGLTTRHRRFDFICSDKESDDIVVLCASCLRVINTATSRLKTKKRKKLAKKKKTEEARRANVVEEKLVFRRVASSSVQGVGRKSTFGAAQQHRYAAMGRD